MFLRFLAPCGDRFRDADDVLVVERHEDHRVRAGVKREPLSRTGLAVPDRFGHFRKRVHIALMEEFTNPLFQRRAKDKDDRVRSRRDTDSLRR